MGFYFNQKHRQWYCSILIPLFLCNCAIFTHTKKELLMCLVRWIMSISRAFFFSRHHPSLLTKLRFCLQANRPITLKKENIQTRNRKTVKKVGAATSAPSTSAAVPTWLAPTTATFTTEAASAASALEVYSSHFNQAASRHVNLYVPDFSYNL